LLTEHITKASNNHRNRSPKESGYKHQEANGDFDSIGIDQPKISHLI